MIQYNSESEYKIGNTFAYFVLFTEQHMHKN